MYRQKATSVAKERSNLATTSIVFVLSLVAFLTFSVSVSAGLSVTPLLLDLTMAPGSSHAGVLSLQNTGSEQVHVESQVRGFKTSDRGVAQFLSDSNADNYPYSGEKLLTITPKETVLESGETHQFSYEISFPDVPEPFGGRYVGALFKATPVEKVKEEEEAGSSIQVATRVGTLILIRPSEEVLVGGSFREFKVDPKIDNFSTKVISEGTRLLISTLVKNEGNIHIRKKEFSGSIVISDGEGEVIDEIKISPHNILPATSYALTELWQVPEEMRGDRNEEYVVAVTIDVLTPYGETIEVKRTLKAKI